MTRTRSIPATWLAHTPTCWSATASTTTGTEITSSDSAVTARSALPRTRLPVHVPSATPPIQPSTAPAASSRTLTPIRRDSSSLTEAPSHVRPKSPTAIPEIHTAYRWNRGVRSLRLAASKAASTAAGGGGGRCASKFSRGCSVAAARR